MVRHTVTAEFTCGLKVKSNPRKTVYNIGESIDSSDLILKAVYSGASTKKNTSVYTISGFDSTPSGVKTVTISCEGKITTINVTVKAAPIKDSYTITFNTNGGLYVNPITAEEGPAIFVPANPTKEGNTFAGWTDVNGNMVSVPLTMPSYNMTLYAKWSVSSYNVTWIVDCASTTVSYKFGATIAKPTDPVKNRYRFVGWTPEVMSIMPANNLVYTAVFKNAEVPHEHSNTLNVSKNLTCDSDGVTTYSCSCGHTFDAIIPARVRGQHQLNAIAQTKVKEFAAARYVVLVAKQIWFHQTVTQRITGKQSLNAQLKPKAKRLRNVLSALKFLKKHQLVNLRKNLSKTVLVKTPSMTSVPYGDSIILNVDASKIPEGDRV